MMGDRPEDIEGGGTECGHNHNRAMRGAQISDPFPHLVLSLVSLAHRRPRAEALHPTLQSRAPRKKWPHKHLSSMCHMQRRQRRQMGVVFKFLIQEIA